MDLKIKTETEEFHGRTCGIIKQENKFLIMRVNKTSYFHIPGGHIEIGEDSKEAIQKIKEKVDSDKYKLYEDSVYSSDQNNLLVDNKSEKSFGVLNLKNNKFKSLYNYKSDKNYVIV